TACACTVGCGAPPARARRWRPWPPPARWTFRRWNIRSRRCPRSTRCWPAWMPATAVSPTSSSIRRARRVGKIVRGGAHAVRQSRRFYPPYAGAAKAANPWPKSKPSEDIMYGNLELFIDGKWHGADGRKGEDVINPATEKPLAHLPHASKADLDQALAAATKGFAVWRAPSAYDRCKILHKA